MNIQSRIPLSFSMKLVYVRLIIGIVTSLRCNLGWVPGWWTSLTVRWQLPGDNGLHSTEQHLAWLAICWIRDVVLLYWPVRSVVHPLNGEVVNDQPGKNSTGRSWYMITLNFPILWLDGGGRTHPCAFYGYIFPTSGNQEFTTPFHRQVWDCLLYTSPSPRD